MDATPLVIATILVDIQTTPAAALSGLSSFYVVAVTRVVSATLAAITTVAVTVFGLSSFYAAAVTEILSANLLTQIDDILILSLRRYLSAAAFFNRPGLTCHIFMVVLHLSVQLSTFILCFHTFIFLIPIIKSIFIS